MKKFPTLYKRTSTGKIQQWTITSDGNAYTVTEGMENGKLTTTAPHTCEGKNPGKKNATTAEEQAEKEAQAKWEKQQRRGYTRSKDTVDETEFEKPQKGYKYSERKDEMTYPVDIQDKLNGVNFRVRAKGILSTGCELFHTVPHIVESFKPIFKKYPKATFVGEGFNPEATFLSKLTELMNVNIQPKDLTPELLEQSEKIAQAWIFDGYDFEGITKKTPWRERLAACAKVLKGLKYVTVTDYEEIENEAALMKALAKNKARKGEGLMIRWGNYPVKCGKSKYLLKLKHMEDAEFNLVALEEGNGDWAGHAKRAILQLPKPTVDGNGKTVTTFASNIKGDMPFLRKLWLNKDKVIGKPATTSYQCLSEYGIPQIPWIEAIRDYETYE